MIAQNGSAHHHSLHIEGLTPATLYAYRVQGAGTWSEWFQFRTASATAQPFQFLYIGDAQNQVKSHVSRVVRQAFQDLPQASMILHAGDLVNGRTNDEDNEWGEWFDTGSWMYSMIPSLVTPGNHDYKKEKSPDGNEKYVYSPHWDHQFTVPGNGPEGLQTTVYYLDMMGVRFVSLNSVSAIEFGTAKAQALWLDSILIDNPNRWTIITFHHPIFSVSRGRDNPELRKYWKPVFDKHGVDLVLQGHDHTYGRGDNEPTGIQAYERSVGTMYLVSVSGPKMYFVSDNARKQMDRVGEDVQLYQIVSVNHHLLTVESRTAAGALYDRFELRKGTDGRNVLLEGLLPQASCARPMLQKNKQKNCWGGNQAGSLEPKYKETNK
jgi:acid phosphatase type 7